MHGNLEEYKLQNDVVVFEPPLQFYSPQSKKRNLDKDYSLKFNTPQVKARPNIKRINKSSQDVFQTVLKRRKSKNLKEFNDLMREMEVFGNIHT